LQIDRLHLFFSCFAFISFDLLTLYFFAHRTDLRNPLIMFFCPSHEEAISIIFEPAATPRKEIVSVISSELMIAKTSARLCVTKSHKLLFSKRWFTSQSFPRLKNISFIEKEIFIYRTSIKQRILKIPVDPRDTSTHEEFIQNFRFCDTRCLNILILTWRSWCLFNSINELQKILFI